MLDDSNVLKQRDPNGALQMLERIADSTAWVPEISAPEHDGRAITSVIVAGMGGSALAARLLQPILSKSLAIPFVFRNTYDLPEFAHESTLVLAVSHSGNTEEAIECYRQARERNCQVGVIGAGGELIEQAAADSTVHVVVPADKQPRMSIFFHLAAELALMKHFGVIDGQLADELTNSADWLQNASKRWHSDVPIHENYAKQLALVAVGKTPVFYGGQNGAGVAYKWKISFNENAKNVAFWNTYPEFNHNEFIGWDSHPIEKPFSIFDLVSKFERERILERMRLSDRLLSGKRPKATEIHLEGDTPLREALWACVLADFTSSYVAILNNVDPVPVGLVERFKQELS